MLFGTVGEGLCLSHLGYLYVSHYTEHTSMPNKTGEASIYGFSQTLPLP